MSSLFAILILLTTIVSAQMTTSYSAPSALSTVTVVSTFVNDGSTYLFTVGTSTIFAGGPSAVSTIPILTWVFSDSTVYVNTIGSSTVFPVPSATPSTSASTSASLSPSSSIPTSTATSVPSPTTVPKSGTNKTAIGLGVGLGLGLGIPLLVGLLWFCKRRSKRTNTAVTSGPELSQARLTSSSSLPSQAYDRPAVDQVANPLYFQPSRQH